MEPDKKSNGALIGAIIIIVILLIGGIYVWSGREAENGTPVDTEVTPADSQELDALEEDLNSADAEIEANVIESVQ